MLANFLLIRGLMIYHVERNADRKCVEYGPDYIRGGKEFYEKSILTNKVLRRLKGYEDEYNAYGNETTWFRLEMRTVNRLDHFEDCCRQTIGAVNVD